MTAGPATPARLTLQWHITEHCNLRCRHCYQAAGAVPPDLAFAELRQILQQFRDLLATGRSQPPRRAHINLTGGEPLARADCFELLELFAADRQRYSFAILTNGTLIDAAMAARLAALRPGFVQVSIEGTEATHDRIRGTGSYRAAVTGLKHLVRNRIHTLIAFTAHRGNVREFPEVARLGRSLGVNRVWVDRLIPCGDAAAMAPDILTPDETRELFETMAAEAKRGWRRRTEISLLRALQFIVGGGVPYRCTAGDGLVTVLANGDLCPCRRLPRTVGNVLRQPLAELYASSPVFCELRNRQRVSAGCEKCFYSHTCGGGLRCLAYAVHGDPFRADPGCWLAVAPAAEAATLAAPENEPQEPTATITGNRLESTRVESTAVDASRFQPEP